MVLILPSIRVANGSCFSLKMLNCFIEVQAFPLQNFQIPKCCSHLAILATRIFCAPFLLEIWNMLLCFSLLACLAIRSMLSPGSFGDRTCSFNSLRLTFLSFNVLQVTQLPSCSRLVDCCPNLIDFIINFLCLPS